MMRLKPGKEYLRRWIKGLVVLLLVFGLTSLSLAQKSSEGTIIRAYCVLHYENETSDGTIQEEVLSSNEVVVKISSVYGAPDIEPNQERDVVAGGIAYFPHTVVNTGNLKDDIEISAQFVNGFSSTDFTKWNFQIYADSNKNGRLDPQETEVISKISALPPDEAFYLIIKVDVPPDVNLQDTTQLEVKATSVGAREVEKTEKVDMVYDTTRITTGPVIFASKEVSTLEAYQGDTINYTIRYINAGTDIAKEVEIKEYEMPFNASKNVNVYGEYEAYYVPGSTRVNNQVVPDEDISPDPNQQIVSSPLLVYKGIYCNSSQLDPEGRSKYYLLSEKEAAQFKRDFPAFNLYYVTNNTKNIYVSPTEQEGIYTRIYLLSEEEAEQLKETRLPQLYRVDYDGDNKVLTGIKLGDLPPGTSGEVTFALALRKNLPEGWVVRNQAIIDYRDSSWRERPTVLTNMAQTVILKSLGFTINSLPPKNTTPGSGVTFDHIVTNIGNGSDRGEIKLYVIGSSGEEVFMADTGRATTSDGWMIALYRADGVTPLYDNDGDGVVDTGMLGGGVEGSLIVKVTPPIYAQNGDNKKFLIKVISKSALDSGLQSLASCIDEVTIARSYGLSLSPKEQTGTASAGNYINLSYKIENKGNGNDEFYFYPTQYAYTGDTRWEVSFYKDFNNNGTLEGGEPLLATLKPELPYPVVTSGMVPPGSSTFLVARVKVPLNAPILSEPLKVSFRAVSKGSIPAGEDFTSSGVSDTADAFLSVTPVYNFSLSKGTSITAVIGQKVVLTHILTNTGNALDQYNLSLTSSRNFVWDIYLDSNGDGEFTPGEDLQYREQTPAINPGSSMAIFLVCTIPSSATIGTKEEVRIRVNSKTSLNLVQAESNWVVLNAPALSIRHVEVPAGEVGLGDFITYNAYVNNKGNLPGYKVIISAIIPEYTDYYANSIYVVARTNDTEQGGGALPDYLSDLQEEAGEYEYTYIYSFHDTDGKLVNDKIRLKGWYDSNTREVLIEVERFPSQFALTLTFKVKVKGSKVPARAIIRGKSVVSYYLVSPASFQSKEKMGTLQTQTASTLPVTIVSNETVNLVRAQLGVSLKPELKLPFIPGMELQLPHILTNTGNVPDSYSLNAFSSKGFPVELYQDINKNGVLEPYEKYNGLITNTGEMAPGETMGLIGVINYPSSLESEAEGYKDYITIGATSNQNLDVIASVLDNTYLTQGAILTGKLDVLPDSAVDPSTNPTLVASINFNNIGLAKALDTRIEETLPEGVSLKPNSKVLFTFNGVEQVVGTVSEDGSLEGFYNKTERKISYSVGEVDIGRQGVLRMELSLDSTLPAVGTIEHLAKVFYIPYNGAEIRELPLRDETSLTGTPKVRIEFVDITSPPQQWVAPGASVDYHFRVTNLGNIDDNLYIILKYSEEQYAKGWRSQIYTASGYTPLTGFSAPFQYFAQGFLAGGSSDFILRVTAPENAPYMSQDITPIAVASGVGMERRGITLEEVENYKSEGIYDGGEALTTVLQACGVVVSPDQQAEARAGNTVYLPFMVMNIGNGEDQFQLQALSSNGFNVRVYEDTNKNSKFDPGEQAITNTPVLGAFGGIYYVIVGVDIPVGIPNNTIEVVTLKATSMRDKNSPPASDEALGTLTILSLPGVTVEPDNASLAKPDTIVNYSHTLTNTSSTIDKYKITIKSSLNWTVFAYLDKNSNNKYDEGIDTKITETPLLNPAVNYDFKVQVEVPKNALAHTEDITTVTATSVTYSDVSDSATDTTMVAPVSAPGVDVFPDHNAQAYFGEKVYFAHMVVNTGNEDDDIKLQVKSLQNWPTRLYRDLNNNGIYDDGEPEINSTGKLTPQASIAVVVEVRVPSNLREKTTDQITVKGVSQYDSSVSDTATDILEALPLYRVKVEPNRLLFANPGETLWVSEAVTNEGNVPDSFNLSIETSSTWSVKIYEDSNRDGLHQLVEPLVTDTGSMLPGAQYKVLLKIVVPMANVKGGEFNLWATSVADKNVKDVASIRVLVQSRYGVEVKPDNVLVGKPAEELVYAHQLINKGNIPATYSVEANSLSGWSAIPFVDKNKNSKYDNGEEITQLGPLNPGAAADFSVLLRVPQEVEPGEYLLIVTGSCVDDNTIRDTAQDITIVNVAGVDISPTQELITQPDTTVVFPHIVTNLGSTADDFALEGVSQNSWPVSLYLDNNSNEILDQVDEEISTPINLSPFIPKNILAVVKVPSSVAPGTVDRVDIQVNSVATPEVKDNVMDTAEVVMPGVVVAPEYTEKVRPGSISYYYHTITNTGSQKDTYQLLVSSDNNWEITLYEDTNGNGIYDEGDQQLSPAWTQIELDSGASYNVIIKLEVPPWITELWDETLTLTAISSINPGVTDEALDKIQVVPPGLVLYPNDSKTGKAGEVVTYTLHLKNTSSLADSYTLAIKNYSNWLVEPQDIETPSIAPQEEFTFNVKVTIPADAKPGDQSITEVTAFSGSDASVNALVYLTTLVQGTELSRYAVVVSPSHTREANPGEILYFPHIVLNCGKETDRFTLNTVSPKGWRVGIYEDTNKDGILQQDEPLIKQTKNLLSEECYNIILRVEVPSNIIDFETETIQIVAVSFYEQLVRGQTSDKIKVLPRPGVVIVPNNAMVVTPGKEVFYPHTITNMGDLADSYYISASSSLGWEVAVYKDINGDRIYEAGEPVIENNQEIKLDGHSSLKILVGIKVPPVVTGRSVDTTEVVVTSVINPKIKARAVDTSAISVEPALRFAPNNAATARPGVNIVYKHTLTNAGNSPDVVLLIAATKMGWESHIYKDENKDGVLQQGEKEINTGIMLSPGETIQILAVIKVPSDARADTKDELTIEAHSSVDTEIVEKVVDTTVVAFIPGVTIAPNQARMTSAGKTIYYHHTITNTGNAEDNFLLRGEPGGEGWCANIYLDKNKNHTLDMDEEELCFFTGTLEPGASVDILVQVGTPGDVPVGMQKQSIITAISMADEAVRAKVIDTTTIIPPDGVVVKKSVDKSKIDIGETLTYTIRYSNPTEQEYKNLEILDVIPLGLNLIKESVTGDFTFNPDTRELIWNIGDLPANSSEKELKFQGTVDLSSLDVQYIINSAYLRSASIQQQAGINAYGESTTVVQVAVPVLTLDSNASLTVATTGDVVTFQLDIGNSNGMPNGFIDVSNILFNLPFGFKYKKGTTQLQEAQWASFRPVGDPLSLGEGRLQFDSLLTNKRIYPKENIRVKFQAIVSAQAVGGDGRSLAEVAGMNFTGEPCTNQDISIIKMEENFFGDRGIIVGRVFEDINGNGMQDEGEQGLSDVVLYMEDGTGVITGKDGKYSIPLKKSGLHVLRLDETSLPTGYYPSTCITNKFANDPASQFVDVPLGGMTQADFAVQKKVVSPQEKGGIEGESK